MRKRILVLANSYKYDGRCVAGRELVDNGFGAYRPSGWVRPISGSEDGEWEPHELHMAPGRPIRVGDVIDIPVTQYADDFVQPENWYCQSPKNWTLVSNGIGEAIKFFEEFPRDLYGVSADKNDRVARDYYLQRPPRQSLCLIRPKAFNVQISSDPETQQVKLRALFRYNHATYNLAITDPLFLSSHYDRPRNYNNEIYTIRIPCGDNLLLCVGLTREYEGYHHKIVATVLEEAIMSSQPSPTIYTIGHSNHEMDTFLALLKQHKITALVDVRSDPHSKYNPQFNQGVLSDSLQINKIAYVPLCKELGTRRHEDCCYQGNKVDYSLVAKSESFLEGLQRLHTGMENYRIALMCAEKDPLYCHRTILVTRNLRQQGVRIEHILEDGNLESQEEAEDRLLSELHLEPGDLFHSRSDMVEIAYEKQGNRLAYVRKDEFTSDET
ncbi:MAG: DUF488 family protein [Gemmataceae bacterium]